MEAQAMNDRRATGAILLMLFTASVLAGGCGGSTSPVAPAGDPTVSTPAVPLPMTPAGDEGFGGGVVRPADHPPIRGAELAPGGE
jgi:hypothetical protein